MSSLHRHYGRHARRDTKGHDVRRGSRTKRRRDAVPSAQVSKRLPDAAQRSAPKTGQQSEALVDSIAAAAASPASAARPPPAARPTSSRM